MTDKHAKKDTCSKCGCEYFVWWIQDQGQYSSKTPWAFYDWQRHPRAACLRCNEPVPRRPVSYDLKQIAAELKATAQKSAYHGNALRVALDIPGVTQEDRILLRSYMRAHDGFDYLQVQLAALADRIAQTKEGAVEQK